ncbi:MULTISPECIES: DUF7667 family protein [Bacillus subtilis group]|uniref:DUF7667 family protein n=1 Tax=Bacillus subtilis group TaxID=653685 RepID=UPI0009495E1C|nr:MULTISPECIES: hypothetical protein [Bacillus subtilis group]OLF99968.1 hypothetical protein B4124_4457 [Bacillus licheniformis]TWK63203.1 hypothetical protein CHCC20342_3075 [Bacillus licheniformis]
MWGVHQRLAELRNIEKNHRALTEEEMSELKICLDANLNKCRKVAALKNLSLLASATNDTDWQHEICNQIEELYADFH